MIAITKPTWTVDGWSGNYVDNNGVAWLVSKDAGWYDPVDVRTRSDEKTVSDGDYSEDNRNAPRVVSLIGHANAPTVQTANDAMDQFTATLRGPGLKPLVVEEHTRSLMSYVRLASAQTERINPRAFDFQLIMTAPDPRKLSTTLNSVTVPLSSPSPGGAQWNGPAGTTGAQWNGPAGTTGMQWWSSGISNLGVIDNTASTADSDILFTLIGPLTNPSILNITTGEVLTYQGVLSTGDTVTIETGTGRVLYGGVDRGPALAPAQLFLAPARTSTTIAFTSSGGSGVLTAAWRQSLI
jgi:hypothetical protein